MLVGKSHTDASDEQLVSAYQRHADPALLAELFSRYATMVFGVCVKYLKDREAAKDMVMHVFERLPSRLVRNEVSFFRGWLYATVKNECLMYLRANQRESKHRQIFFGGMENEVVWHLNGEPQPDDDLEKLKYCIEQLVAVQRTCVELFFLESKSYQEIVTLTEFDLKQVKSYIQNGRRNLKLCIQQRERTNATN